MSGVALREMDDGMRTAVRCAREVVEEHDPSRNGLIHNLRRLEEFVDWYAAFETRSSLEDSIPAAVSGPPLHTFKPHRRYPWFCDRCGYPPHEPLKHPQPSAARLSPTPVEEA